MKSSLSGSKRSRLLVAAVAILVSAIPAFAATTGTLTLTGTVPAVLDISVAAQPAAASLDLSVNQANLLIANVTERSNRKPGYTVSLQSSNAGAGTSFFFKSADVLNVDTLTYTLTYGGTPISLVAGSALITDATAKTSGTGVTKDLRISYSGAASFLNEDSYSDTLTFTITAK
jgi:hypothetical protein